MCTCLHLYTRYVINIQQYCIVVFRLSFILTCILYRQGTSDKACLSISNLYAFFNILCMIFIIIILFHTCTYCKCVFAFHPLVMCNWWETSLNFTNVSLTFFREILWFTFVITSRIMTKFILII